MQKVIKKKAKEVVLWGIILGVVSLFVYTVRKSDESLYQSIVYNADNDVQLATEALLPTYTDPQNRFTFSYNEAWEVISDVDGNITVINPNNVLGTLFIHITEHSIERFVRDLDATQSITNRDFKTMGDKTGVLLTITDEQGGISYTWYLPGLETNYAITFDPENADHTFILESFKIRGDTPSLEPV